MMRLNWCQFHDDCDVLAKRIKESGRTYDKILCVTRGGVFVGGLLAHILDYRDITTIALRLYDDTKKNNDVEELSHPDLPAPGAKILIVDDLLDSGRTIEYIMSKWGDKYDIDIAVLYDKGGGKYRPNFMAQKIPNVWVWFPWEPRPEEEGEAGGQC